MAKKKTAQPARNRGAIQANPGTSYKELLQMLKVLGFIKIRQKGSHQIFMSPTGRKISLPAKKKKSELMSPHYEKQIRAAMMNPMDPMVGVAFMLDAMMSTGGSCANYLIKGHIRIYKELESDGLVKITLIDGPRIIRDEEGPIEVYTICADITPKGRRVYKGLRDRGLLNDPTMKKIQELLDKFDKKKVKNPSMSLRQDMAMKPRLRCDPRIYWIDRKVGHGDFGDSFCTFAAEHPDFDTMYFVRRYVLLRASAIFKWMDKRVPMGIHEFAYTAGMGPAVDRIIQLCKISKFSPEAAKIEKDLKKLEKKAETYKRKSWDKQAELARAGASQRKYEGQQKKSAAHLAVELAAIHLGKDVLLLKKRWSEPEDLDFHDGPEIDMNELWRQARKAAEIRKRRSVAEAEREARDRNPSKKRKSKAPTAAELKSECRRLWEHYCERPNKTRLKAVLKHCEKMAESTAKSVKEERQRCMRSARREMKKLGMK